METATICNSNIEDAQHQGWHSRLPTWNQKIFFTLQTGRLSDVSFVMERDGEKVSLKAHKLLLAMSSPVFENMFFGKDPLKTDVIKANYENYEALISMLNFIYRGTIQIRTLEAAYGLYNVSKEYALELLTNNCLDYISTKITVSNALKIFEFALINRENNLMTKALHIVKANASDILATDEFANVELTTVEAIFEQDNLNIKSEAELVVALAKYITTRNLSKEDVKKAISLIRFQTLSQSEASECQEMATILNTEEHLSILTKRVADSLNCSLEPRSFSCGTSHQAVPSEHRATKNFRQFHNSNPRKSAIALSSSEDVLISGILIQGQNQPRKCREKTYCEKLKVNMADASGEVFYSHDFASDVDYDCLINVKFAEPIRVDKLKRYRLEVVFERIGTYEVHYSCAKFEAGNVLFEVSPDDQGESLLNGTLTAIDFTKFM